ncbi:hypothetical protein CC86DRAFT_67689 [Ophiobolus disseminans]|uniref:Uncharacterized protein n=1 Tax=Ophiobolus disseminans TaxID=1469910 RepID=A0A6A6ZS66_9PLEO|nr:hypothetical protein CC86DRAFT_67689 [Ophiobolus disseminans]
MRYVHAIIQYKHHLVPSNKRQARHGAITNTTSTAEPSPLQSSHLDVILTLSAVAIMLLIITILPGLAYALAAAWDIASNPCSNEDEVFATGRNHHRPMSADQFDEYVVLHRPDLLFIDAVATQESNFNETSSRPCSKRLSDSDSLPNMYPLAGTALLVGGMAADYGTMG